MSDKFQGTAQSLLTPSEHAYAVTPNDNTALVIVPKFLYIGGAGNVTLRTKDSASDVVFMDVPAGGYLYVRASHVRATGTTATAIVACA